MNIGVLVFPGSNCDDDIVHVFQTVLGGNVSKIWHKETDLSKYNPDLIVVPGGFSYGDYLRSGAIARFSPIMQEVIKFADNGGYVYGICNGFQILCEAGLLPGVLLPNSNQKFVCKNVYLKVKTTNTNLTATSTKNQVIKIPVAHADGRYHCDAATLDTLKANDQVLFTYVNADGEESDDANFNGSVENIAGICNESRNVFGMMPHPERAAEDILGNTDGLTMLQSLVSALEVA